jgi:hypothetical protein
MRRIIYTIGVFGALGLSLIFGQEVLAARFDLSPASAQFIEGCDSAIDISINPEGDISDAANIIIHYDPALLEIIDTDADTPGIQIRGGNAYEAYVDNIALPDGTIRLTGFSFARRVTTQKTFGTIIFRGKPGVTAANFTIEYVPGSTLDSNIAEYLTSDDLLTGVTNGSYTFRTGDCVADTTPPWVTNPFPAPGARGVPLDTDINFRIHDNRSGVDLSTVRVNVDGTIYSRSGAAAFTSTGTPLDYFININPAADFVSGLPVLVEINAADLAGNVMPPYRYIFNEPVAPPPPPPSCESLGCAEPTTCAAEPDLPEIIEAEPTVPLSQHLSVLDVYFYVANGSIQIFPNERGEVTSVRNTPLTVSIVTSKLPREVDQIIFTVNNFSYLLGLQDAARAYQTVIQTPNYAGRFPFTVALSYKDGANDRIAGTLVLENPGFYWQGLMERRLPGGKITLYNAAVGENIWGAERFNQNNPETTDAEGEYVFFVPNGRYYLLAEKEGYRDERTGEFEVTNNIVNRNIETLIKPLTLEEEWDPNADLLDNLLALLKNLAKKIYYAGQVARKDVLDNPTVEDFAEKSALPIAALALLNYATAISLASLFPYLQFIFTQPVSLLFRKKRKGWGVVYNSLSKMPVDLAIVRIYEKVTGRLVQTRVTDRDGRYAFWVEPGTYTLSVTKPNFTFPTYFLKDKKEDIKFIDIYHGEELLVSAKNTLLTPNVPLDPVEVDKTAPDKKVLLAYFGRKFQDVFAASGIVLAAISAIISPKIWMIFTLAAHILLFVLFKRLARPRRPKSWGMVYERKSRAPVPRAVARIFETEYNKLLESQVTDMKGRYSFLVGQNKYYVTFSKPGFMPKRTEAIDLTSREKDAAVGLDVALERTTV